jgi:hypothetical protein
MQASLQEYRNAYKRTKSQLLTARGEAAVDKLQLNSTVATGGAFADIQGPLSCSSTDKSSWWSGNATSATSSSDADSHASATSVTSSSSSTRSSVDSSDGVSASLDTEMGTSVDISDSKNAQAAVAGPSADSGVDRGAPDATGSDASSAVLVTLDVSSEGGVETDLLAAVCLGRISQIVGESEVPDGPNVHRNRRIYAQDDLLACLAAYALLSTAFLHSFVCSCPCPCPCILELPAVQFRMHVLWTSL